MIVKSKDKFYDIVNVGQWAAKVPLTVLEVTAPCHRRNGHKIHLSLWREVLSFFEWSQEETKSETLVDGFYHDERGWKFLVMPQKGHTGMSVEPILDHPERIPTLQRLGGEGWSPMATFHHHCKGSAFQSGTDERDEKGREGLHITVGGIGNERYSLDARATPPMIPGHPREMSPAVLSDWFEIPEEIAQVLPREMHEQYLGLILTAQPAFRSFPDWWKANVIKVPPQVSSGLYHGHPYDTTHGYGNGYVASRRTTNQWLKEKFVTTLKEICTDYGMDLNELESMVLDLNNDPWSELINSMVYCEIGLDETLRAISDLKDKAKEADPALDYEAGAWK